MPAPFDAVLFDLDGTLVATDRFWVRAASAGCRRAFEELGLDRPRPTAADWMSMVGEPLGRGMDRLFADLAPQQRALVQRRCSEEEAALLRAGGAALLPGVESTLRELRGAGVRTGIASNCGRDYLAHMLEGLGLGALVDEARCLDSPGVGDKADMLADLLLTFDTRSAVMVGDRVFDRDAAWANGLPYVHCGGGFAPEGERVEAEAVIDDMHELRDRLAGRERWIRAALDALGLLRPTPPRAVGIGGPPAAGKSLFARDAARLLEDAGLPARAVPLDAFRTPRNGAPDARGGEDPLAAGFALDELLHELLEPHARGESAAARGIAVAPGEILLLEGPFLQDPRLATRLDRLLWLDAPEELRLRRLAGRDGRLHGPAALEEARTRTLPVQAAFDRALPPAGRADLVLDASNPLGGPP